MSKAIAAMAGIFLVGHGFINLFIEGHHFLLFNTDILLDLMHLAFGALLLFVSRDRAPGALVGAALALTAVVFAVVGLFGLIDRHLGGIAPTGLAPGDYLLYFGIAAATALGVILPHSERPIWEEHPRQSV